MEQINVLRIMTEWGWIVAAVIGFIGTVAILIIDEVRIGRLKKRLKSMTVDMDGEKSAYLEIRDKYINCCHVAEDAMVQNKILTGTVESLRKQLREVKDEQRTRALEMAQREPSPYDRIATAKQFYRFMIGKI